MIRHLLLVLRISPIKLWCATPSWPSYFAQVPQSPYDQFCQRNRQQFASKWFFHKQLSLDLARARRPTRWTVVLFRAHMHKFMSCHLWRSYKLVLKHTTSWFSNISLHQSIQTLFLSDCQTVRHPKGINSFNGHLLLKYRKCAGGRNAQGCLYFTVCHMMIWHYQFSHGVNVLGHNSHFRTTFADFVFERPSATIEFIKPNI